MINYHLSLPGLDNLVSHVQGDLNLLLTKLFQHPTFGGQGALEVEITGYGKYLISFSYHVEQKPDYVPFFSFTIAHDTGEAVLFLAGFQHYYHAGQNFPKFRLGTAHIAADFLATFIRSYFHNGRPGNA